MKPNALSIIACCLVLAAAVFCPASPLLETVAGSRLPGQAGYAQTLEILEKRLGNLGAARIFRHEFPLAVPGAGTASVTVAGRTFPLHSLAPNLVTFGLDDGHGLSGELLFVGQGGLEELRGVPIQGRIVIAELTSGRNWLELANFGAAAFIFLQPAPGVASYDDYRTKVLDTPVDMPRFLLQREERAGFLEAVEAGRGSPGKIVASAGWQQTDAVNLVAYIPAAAGAAGNGTVEQGEDLVLIHCALDATSLVPGLAPGAEGLLNLLAFERLAERYAATPPPVPLLLVAFSGNSQALAGAKHFVYDLLTSAGRQSREQRLAEAAELEELEAQRAMLDAAALADPVGFLRRLASGKDGYRQPLVKQLYAIVNLELAELSRRVISLNQTATAGDAGAAAEISGLVARRRELNFLYTLRYRNFKTQEEAVQATPELLKIFRAKDADAPEDPAVTAAAPEHLRHFLELLAGRLERRAAKLREQQAQAEKLAEFATFLANRRIAFHLGLDVSLNAESLVLAGEGDHYRLQNHDRLLRSLGRALKPFTERFNAASAEAGAPALVNVLAQELQEHWRNYVLYPVAGGGEALAIAGIPGLTICGGNDLRNLHDTPEDTPDRLRGDRTALLVARTAACAAGLVDEIAAQIRVPAADKRHKLLPAPYGPDNNFWGVVEGTASRGGRGNADRLVKGIENVMVVRHGDPTSQGINHLKGLRNYEIARTDGLGNFRFVMVPARRTPMAGNRRVELNAFRLSPLTGRIDQAMDRGPAGSAFPTRFELGEPVRSTSLVMFDCHGIGILNCFDPRTAKPLRTPGFYSGDGNQRLRVFGYHETLTANEAAAACFVPPESRVKLVFSGPDFFMRMMLLGSGPDNHLGRGFSPLDTAVLPHPALTSANDMWWRTENLRGSLARAGIRNNFIDYLQEQAKASLETARTSLEKLDYAACRASARLSWSLVSRGYPTVLKLTNGTVYGLIFYVFMIIPCALLLERLLLSLAKILHRGLAAVGIGVLLYFILRLLHPAFRIVQNPFVLFIAFGLIALSIFVASVVWARFEGYVQRWKAKKSGVTRESLSRGAALGVALSAGIGNMRRMPARTALTLISLTLFTVVVVSLVSVRASLAVNRVKSGYRPSLTGLLVRDPKHEDLSPVLVDDLRAFYGADCRISEIRMETKTLSWTPEFRTAAILSGLPPELESQLLAGGAGLDQNSFTCLLPDIRDPRRGLDTAALVGREYQIAGMPVRVVGTFDAGRMERLTGLDGEPVTPIDLKALREIREANRTQGQEDMDIVPPRVPALQTVILSAPAMRLIGGLRDAVVLSAERPGILARIAQDMVLRGDFYCYLSEDSGSWVLSMSDRDKVKGLSEILIPILICGFIILNTMLGAVASQMRHIPTFSAVGLAPRHIASLFFVEAAVYSVLAVMGGYIFGQVTAKGIAHSGLIQGMMLDYSSSSAILGSMIVVAVTILSTIYPAHKAMTVAVPKSEDDDRPQFEDGRMTSLLPFTLTGRHAAGGIGFLYKFIASHEEMIGAESFFVRAPSLTRSVVDGRPRFDIRFDMWLPPIDLGNSQQAHIWTETDEHEISYIHVDAVRRTGEDQSWRMCNLAFSGILRRQMLLWRMVEEQQRDFYLQMALDAPLVPAATPAPAVAANGRPQA